jgi:manganese/iron transport system substrate-binding protein
MQAKTHKVSQNSWLLAAVVLLGLCMGGCTQQTSNNPQATNDNKPDVVSTSTMIADLTKQVGGKEIDVVGILQPGDDPHIYEPVPEDSKALEEAELILYNGYNLEPNLIKMMNATGVNARKVAVGEVIPPLQLNEGKKGKVPDPHVWGDAKNSIKMVNLIRDELIKLSPENKDEFTQNAANLTSELQRLDQWISQQIQTIPANQRQLVTTHDAFQYYANAYGLKVAGTLIGISTEEQPSAQTVQKLSDSIKNLGVPTIFAETTINPRLITTVAEEANVKLASQALYSDSIGAPGSDGDTYIKMMVSNTRVIVENLGGQYSAFQPQPSKQ